MTTQSNVPTVRSLPGRQSRAILGYFRRLVKPGTGTGMVWEQRWHPLRREWVVVSNGWAMLKQKEEPDRGRDVQKKVDLQDIFRNAFYPLTLPLTVGPGSISVAITLGANLTHPLRTNLSAILATLIGSGVVAATIYVCYGFADRM